MENINRREFIKKVGLGIGATLIPKELSALKENKESLNKYTEFKPTREKFKNGEFVYSVESEGSRVGEFWPVKGINLVTKETDPQIFSGDLSDINTNLKGVATAPDGMSAGSLGNYKMEGKSLSNGRECGDGNIPNYGIVLVKKGFDITFTHKKEILDFQNFYNEAKNNKNTLFFLPSIYRNGNFLDSKNFIDKILIRRENPNNATQIGVILFDSPISGNDAREIVLGLDRNDQQGKSISKTTHIYVLDGGPNWGGSLKEVYRDNQKTPELIEKGTRDPEVVTNYLVFY
ncbi:MAG: hypothetical protein KBD14_00650 [Candidatus Pacebacteria bacterium]|nr:hypothetical protein [Candidatus Paceibacterota bacterium]